MKKELIGLLASTIIGLSCMAAGGCGASSNTADAGLADGSAGDGGADTGSITLWRQPDQLALAEPYYAGRQKVFGRMSRWMSHLHEPLPNVGHRGSFGTGNGRTFGFIGLADPANTLHSLVGPTYERQDETFFGDYSLLLLGHGDNQLASTDEWVMRSLSAPVIVTRGVYGEVEMDTIDFAPLVSDPGTSNCFLRIILARNKGAAATVPLSVRVSPFNKTSAFSNDGIMEVAGSRSLVTRFAASGEVVSGRLYGRLGSLGAGEEKSITLMHCSFEGKAGGATPAVIDADSLLSSSADAYTGWEGNLVSFDLPDPMVRDFMDGMKMTLKVQTAATGASCPMSEYTRTWTRDNIGPALAWADLGAFEDMEAALDYLYAAILFGGDMKNSYPADLDTSNPPPPPDWDSMPVMKGRTAAESPSYTVMMYGLHNRYTGDTTRAAERFGMLSRCIFKQEFGVDHLLPYSGDETYRAAMNAAFGLSLDYSHDTLSFSPNSSILWLAAADQYRRLADETGHSDKAGQASDLAALVEEGFMKHFFLENGCIGGFIDRETMKLWDAPFEDESMQVTWSGWKNGDDDLAQSTVNCLLDTIYRQPGVLMSRLAPMYRDYFPGAKKGMYTGMLPGFTLSMLTETGHPQAVDAFNIARNSIDGSGNLLEDMIYDDFSGLSIIYDQSGKIGDYTAKFRPWEGGIVFDALFKYLTGFSPDHRAKTISLRPHLPNNWPSMGVKNLRVGSDRFDLTVERTGDGSYNVKLASRAAGAYSVKARWDGKKPAFTANGLDVPENLIIRYSHFDQDSAMTPAFDLPAGGTITFGVTEAP